MSINPVTPWLASSQKIPAAVPTVVQCRTVVSRPHPPRLLSPATTSGVGLGSRPRNHFLWRQGRTSTGPSSSSRRASVVRSCDDVSVFVSAAVGLHPGVAERCRALDPERRPEHRLPQLHRRLAALGQQVDHAAAQARREALLPGDILQGKLLSSDAVLQVSRHAPSQHNVAGGERQAGEVHQRFRAGARALLDLRHGPGRRGPLLLDVDRPSHNLHQLERRRTQQLPVRERRRGELPGVVEPRRQRPQVERLSLFVRDVLRV